MGRLIFAGEAEADALAQRLCIETRESVGLLTRATGPLALRRVITEMGDGRMPIVVATQKWDIGWRAPRGWTVEFDKSFTEDLRHRAQARARVPA